jgi:hypothetical protein
MPARTLFRAALPPVIRYVTSWIEMNQINFMMVSDIGFGMTAWLGGEPGRSSVLNARQEDLPALPAPAACPVGWAGLPPTRSTSSSAVNARLDGRLRLSRARGLGLGPARRIHLYCRESLL